MTEQYGAPPTSQAFGGWGSRVGAYFLDAAPIIVLFVVLSVLFGESETGNGGFSLQLTGLPAAVYFLGAIGWFVYNWLLGQGRTGQTMGKKVLGIGVFKAGTSEPIGPGLTFVRQIAHILDGIPCLIGYLWPLWDKEKRTFADMVMSTRVYKV